jgi:hypothetical protein
VKIGVHHSKPSETDGKIAGNHPDLDRAVTAKHKVALASPDDVTNSVPHTGDILDNGLDILRARAYVVGYPPTQGKIAMINHLDPRRCQRIEKPCIA